MEGLFGGHWNPSWNSMPWKHFSSPAERFQVLPTFVVGEFVFMLLSLITLIHAVKQGRMHLMVWVGSFVTGTANDAFFMALPIVDNFWQSQACVMLTPRMPLYIPLVYNAFMYTSTVAAWRLNLRPLAEAALTGIMAEMIYAPYDVTGIKFLWWTWHDTDAPIDYRILGVPIGSTVWVITFTATFQFLFRKFVLDSSTEQPSAPRMLFFGIALNALLATPLMMVQMAVLQLVSGDTQGRPTVNSLLAVLVIYGALNVFSSKSTRRRRPVKDSGADSLLKTFVTLYFVYLVANMLIGVPESHVSTGVHQTVGPCNVTDADLAGHSRQVYLCPSTHDEDWTFGCASGDTTPPDLTEWYTVCGKPHSNKPLWTAYVAALAALGIGTYRFCLSRDGKRDKIA